MTNLICNKKAIILACLLVLNTSLVYSDDNYDFEESSPEVYFYTVPQGQIIETPKNSKGIRNNMPAVRESLVVQDSKPLDVIEEVPLSSQPNEESNEFIIETKTTKKDSSNFVFKPLKFFKSNFVEEENSVQANEVEEEIKPVVEAQPVVEVKPVAEFNPVLAPEPVSASVQEEKKVIQEPVKEEVLNFNTAVDEFFDNQTPQAVQITKDDTSEQNTLNDNNSNVIESEEEFSPIKTNEEFIKQKLKEQQAEVIVQNNKIEKSVKKDRKLTGIQKKIEKEQIFKHDTVNNLYLDKYNTILDDKSKTFYAEKNIEQNEDGLLQLTTEADKPSIYELIKTIENSNPNNVFEPPVKVSLRDCIGIAIAKHPSVISAQINTEIYKSRIVQAWAAYFPSLSAGVDYSYMHSKVPDYSYGMHSAYFPNASAGLLLFDFGKTKTQADIAKVDYSASKFDLQNSINDIVYSVKSAYYNLLFAQKQVEVYKRTIEQFELHLQSAQKYFSIGKKPQVDVAIAEYNVGSAKLNLVKAMNTLEVAKINLANTLGLPEFANFELCDDLEKYDYSTDLEALLQDAFTIRPDLLSFQKMVENSLLSVRSARRGFTPDLTANSSFYRGGADPMKETNYNLSVNLSYSGMNLLQLKKEYDIAKKSYEKTLNDYEQKRQSVYLEVKEAYINLNNSKETVKQSELNVGQAKAQHYHATGRYKAGLGDAIELKDSENTYMNAQLEYYQSLLDYNNDIANLERVVGRPIEVTKSKL